MVKTGRDEVFNSGFYLDRGVLLGVVYYPYTNKNRSPTIAKATLQPKGRVSNAVEFLEVSKNHLG